MKGMRKIKRGTGFRGVLDYAFGRDMSHKDDPGVLIGGNLSGTDPKSLSKEFGITRNIRPEIEKPVWHNSLRLPEGERISNEQWVKIADDYMKEMGFSDLHPRCYVLHDDAEGQHIHIIASRIAMDGTLYLGKNENLASTRIIQSLEIEHGLNITKGQEYDGKKIKMPDQSRPKKGEIEKAIRTKELPPRLRLQKLIDAAIENKPTAVELAEYMEAAGVEVKANMASTGKMNGFSFSLDGVAFSGSKLGDNYKWANLLKRGVSYDKARDSEGLARYKPAVANRAVISTGLSGDTADADGVIYIAASDSRSDHREPGADGENGAGTRSRAGYTEGDYGAADSSSYRIHPESDAELVSRQGETGRGDGERTPSQNDEIRQIAQTLDGNSESSGGGNPDIKAESLDSLSINSDTINNSSRDDFGGGSVKPRWNDRFKKKSAEKKREKKPDYHQDFSDLRDVAHMADLVAYIESVGLPVQKDGKDWSVDDRYRVTQKSDGHFVWCDWSGATGGDAIDFCTKEMGMTFQQALADLSGSIITKKAVKKPISQQAQPFSAPPVCRNSDPIMLYLQNRGISQKTVRQAQGAGFLRFVDYSGIPSAAFCGRDSNGNVRSMTARLTRPISSFDGEKQLTKLDIRHSDKSYPAIWLGDDSGTVWVVEGGIDALAVIDWHKAHRQPAPCVIVSGGAGVRSFLDQPHVQSILKKAATVYVSFEREKDAETQAKTDAAHERQINTIWKLGCEKVIAWMPPAVTKDIAEAWKAGALPDPHDPLAHLRAKPHEVEFIMDDNDKDLLFLPRAQQ